MSSRPLHRTTPGRAAVGLRRNRPSRQRGDYATTGLAAAQQSYPVRPIRMLVPFVPGGGTDISALVIAQKMTEALHQQVIVDNRTGASGHIAMEIAARAAPDVSTLIMSTVASMAFSPALFTNLMFDPLKDYSPVALASSTVFAVVFPPGLPAKSVKELIALAKSQPGKLSYASGGTGARRTSRPSSSSSWPERAWYTCPTRAAARRCRK